MHKYSQYIVFYDKEFVFKKYIYTRRIKEREKIASNFFTCTALLEKCSCYIVGVVTVHILHSTRFIRYFSTVVI